MTISNMAPLHPQADWGALDTHWLPLVRLGDEVKQAPVAELLGIDPGDLSRFKKGNYKLTVAQFYALLKATNTKVVDAASKCVTPEAYKVINECPELAQKILRQQPQLIWGDE